MAKADAALKKAIKNGNLREVTQLLDDGLPIDAELPGKVTALEFALAAEKRDIVEELLKRGAKPRKQKNDNLLLDVPKFRDAKLLRQLVELGADIHAADRNGFTPLLMAVAAGFYDAVEFLLELGADPNVRTKDGDSVFDLAERTRQFCLQLLPSSEGEEVGELFRAQLADLDRILPLIQSKLSDAQVKALQEKPKEPLQPSTFWSLNGDVEFRIEVSPFPFTSQKTSKLKARMPQIVKSWDQHFKQKEGQIFFRVHSGEPSGEWVPFTYMGWKKNFLFFEGETCLPTGKAVIEIRIDSDQGIVDGEIPGWEIAVDEPS